MAEAALYRRIAEDLLQKIEAGEVGREAGPLPTELELREMYDASRNTVRDAIKWLISRGVVETQPGRGTFVVQKIKPYTIPLSVESGVGSEANRDFQEDVLRRLRRPTVSAPVIEIKQAGDLIATELQLAKGDNIVSRHQRRFIDDTPWSLQTSYYPMTYVERGATDLILAQDMHDGVVKYLQDSLGIEQVGWRDRITVRAPDQTESTFFRLPDDGRIPVFEVQRTGYDDKGRPIRHTVTTYPTDRNQFVATGGKVPDDSIILPAGSISPAPSSQPSA